MTPADFAKTIDSSLLNPTADESQVREVCRLARKYKFATVALGCQWIPLAAELLEGSGVGVDAPIGFPLGYSTTEAKVFETRDALQKGATEIDMVMNLGYLKSGRDAEIIDEIKQVVAAADGHIVKVIIETYYLTEEEKIRAAKLVAEAGADFVKTSTGFTPGGATVEDVTLLYKAVGDKIKIKASGGIRNYDQAMSLLKAGAERLGASRAHLLMEPLEK